jgi:hypothetical protein
VMVGWLSLEGDRRWELPVGRKEFQIVVSCAT